MQASFYTSGFLYNLKTHRILLLQSKQRDESTSWTMLGGEGIEGEGAEVAFQRIINKKLNINLKSKDIYPVYDYISNIQNKPHYVFYVEVKNSKSFNDLKKGCPSWVSFSETTKLSVSIQTKQDIVVGERVINAKWRDDEAERNHLTP